MWLALPLYLITKGGLNCELKTRHRFLQFKGIPRSKSGL